MTKRLTSLVLALCLALGGAALSGYRVAEKYRTSLEYTYLRALNDLTDYMANLEIALQKGMYANTSAQQYGLTSKIQREAEGAKSALGQLPLSDTELDDLNKYIAQVGDYAQYLSRKLSSGGRISEEEMGNLKTLAGYAKDLTLDLQDISARFSDGSLHIGEAVEASKNLSEESEQEEELYLNSGFHEMSEGFVDYPTLIYDGPFSDHITQRKPKLLEGLETVSEENARSIAAEFLGVEPSSLSLTGNSAGNMPTYSFGREGMAVTVTKAGGYVDYMLDSREIGESTIGFEEATQKAKAFLSAHGMDSLQESYYVTANGICTINYAYEHEGVTYYSDLVKVGVALDDGSIVAFSATGYLMNHTERAFEEPALSLEEARAVLSPNLQVEREGMACVPTSGLNEVLCYEFECSGENGDRVLVYVNASTGMEENIFILLMSDGGTLVM